MPLSVSSSYQYKTERPVKEPVYLLHFEGASEDYVNRLRVGSPDNTLKNWLKNIRGNLQSITPEEGKSSIGQITVGLLDARDAVGDELVTNGDNEAAKATFDEDDDVYCSSIQSAEQKRDGSYSTKITLDGTHNFGYRIFRDTDCSIVTAGKSYKISVWVYLPSGQTMDGVSLGLRGNTGSYEYVTTYITDTWVELSACITVSDGLWARSYGFDSGLVANSDYFYLDNLSIKELDNALTHLMGDDPTNLHRRKATVKAGYVDMTEEDMGTIFTGWVTDIKLWREMGGYDFVITDPQKWLQRKIFRGTEVSSFCFMGNPIDILLAVLTSTGSGTNGNYDLWTAEQGLGMDESLIAVSELETLRDNWLAGVRFSFSINEREVAKAWLEREIFKPCNLYPVVKGDGTFTAIHYHPPMDGLIESTPQVFDKNVIIGEPQWDQGLSGLINEVEFHYDWNATSKDFESDEFHLDSTSVNSRGPGKKTLKIESKGLTTAEGGADFTLRRSKKVFGRYATPPPEIRLKTFFSRHLSEVGDIVPVSHPDIPDLKTGQRGVSSHYMEIVNRQVNWEKGYCSFTLLHTSWEGEKFGVVAPSARVHSGTDRKTFVVQSGYGSRFVAGDVIDLFRENMTVIDSGFSVGSVNGDIITLTSSLSVTPSSGQTIAYSDFDAVTDSQKSRFAFVANSAGYVGSSDPYYAY